MTKITEPHIQPATKVEQVLAAHPDNDIIWNTTDPCDISLDNTSNFKGTVSIDLTKEPVKTTTTPMSIKIGNNSNATQDSVVTTITIMSEENDETWYEGRE